MSVGRLFLIPHSDLLACFGFCKIKYAGADTETSMASPPHSFCRQISRKEFEQQGVSGSQGAIVELLENIIHDKNMSIKDKKKKLKQVREDDLGARGISVTWCALLHGNCEMYLLWTYDGVIELLRVLSIAFIELGLFNTEYVFKCQTTCCSKRPMCSVTQLHVTETLKSEIHYVYFPLCDWFYSVPEISSWHLPQTLSHRWKRGSGFPRETPETQTSADVPHAEETLPALPEELELSGLSPCSERSVWG